MTNKYIMIIFVIIFLLFVIISLNKVCNKSNENFVNSIPSEIRTEIFNTYNNDINYIKKMIQIAQVINDTNRFIVADTRNIKPDSGSVNLNIDTDINVQGDMPNISASNKITTGNISTNELTINNVLTTQTLESKNAFDISNKLTVANNIKSNNLFGTTINSNNLLYKNKNVIDHIKKLDASCNELIVKYNIIASKFNTIKNTNNNIIPVISTDTFTVDNLNLKNINANNISAPTINTKYIFGNNINVDNYALYNYKTAKDKDKDINKTNAFMIGRSDIKEQIMPIISISSNSNDIMNIYNSTNESPNIATNDKLNITRINSITGNISIDNQSNRNNTLVTDDKISRSGTLDII